MLYRYVCSGIAGDELSILEKLSEHCLSTELCEKIRHMKGFRNILVHGYTSLNDALVYNNIFHGRAYIYQFMEEVEDCLKNYTNRYRFRGIDISNLTPFPSFSFSNRKSGN